MLQVELYRASRVNYFYACDQFKVAGGMHVALGCGHPTAG